MQIDGAEIGVYDSITNSTNNGFTKDPLDGLAPEFLPAEHQLGDLLRKSIGVRMSYSYAYISPDGMVLKSLREMSWRYQYQDVIYMMSNISLCYKRTFRRQMKS